MSVMAGIGRRRFLRTLLTAGCGCLLAPMAMGWPAQADSKGGYYLQNAALFEENFAGLNHGAMQYLSLVYNPRTARAICAKAPNQFKKLLRSLPDIGGDANLNTRYLILAAQLISYWPLFQEQGLEAQDLGRMLYQLYLAELQALPPDKARAMGQARFSSRAQESLRKWCAWTQERTYPGNWVTHYVPGDGEFDFGYDIVECGALKLFQAQGARQVAPYFCLNDFIRSQTPWAPA